MDVLFLSPHYPPEMQHFTRGLAEVGARVWGVADCAVQALPAHTRHHLAGFCQVPGWGDEERVIQTLERWLGGRRPDRVETLWEPLVMLAAKLRARWGLPGLTPAQAHRFRDKVAMKQAVEAAGLRTPRSRRATTEEGVLAAAAEVGFPICIKPIAGAGSKDTYRVNSRRELLKLLPKLRHVPEVGIEEFIDGEEFTFDGIWVNGRLVFHSITQYHPRPLQARSNEWISPGQHTWRDPAHPHLAGAYELGVGVGRALEMGTGFTHMEWYRTSKGEVVFGEIGARNGGGHLVDMMNFSCDIDVFTGWAEAVCHGRWTQEVERRWHVGLVFKRAKGQGRIKGVSGLRDVRQFCGPHIVWENLLPVGSPRRDWHQTLTSDGFICVRHRERAPVIEMMQVIQTRLALWAG